MKMLDTMRDVLRVKGHEVWTLNPEASVYHAVEIMAEKHVGALFVRSGDELVGVISERDYARKVILKGKSSKETLVKEIMTSPIIFVDSRQTIDDCMRIMTENRIRHLPVTENDKVIGIVSIGDLVKWVISTQKETIQQLQDYIAGRYPL